MASSGSRPFWVSIRISWNRKGLEQWPELNGRIYDKLPSEIKKGLDRRSISYIVLLKESASTTEEEDLLRQEVFERLNTGGISLGQQEIRNALYQSKFNALLLELTRNAIFRTIWGLPPYSEEAEQKRSEELVGNRTYVLMRDAEIVLRFFALRHVDHYQRGMKGFLDLYMLRARTFGEEDISYLRKLFDQTLELGWQIYGDLFAKPWDIERQAWAPRPQVAFADVVMVGVSRHIDATDKLVEHRAEVLEATKGLFKSHEPGTFTGRGNTKRDVQDRIRLFDEMILSQATEINV